MLFGKCAHERAVEIQLKCDPIFEKPGLVAKNKTDMFITNS